MSIVRRALGVKISLAQEKSGVPDQRMTFVQGGNTVTLPNDLRMSASILHAGGLSDGTMNLTIYGMSDSLMKQLSTLGMQINLVPKNPITLTAGDGNVMATAFEGYITEAFADYNAQPEVAFYIQAHTLAAFATAPAAPSSYKGPADVATIMSGYATKMGLRFENSGVQTKLPNCYFPGSLRAQAQAVVKQAGISWNAAEGGLLAIWPKNGVRNGKVLVVAPPPKGNMQGYPTYTAYGIMLRNLYDPNFGLGQQISVESSVLTTGQWGIWQLSHQLESEVAGGKWETMVQAYNPKFPKPVLS